MGRPMYGEDGHIQGDHCVGNNNDQGHHNIQLIYSGRNMGEGYRETRQGGHRQLDTIYRKTRNVERRTSSLWKCIMDRKPFCHP